MDIIKAAAEKSNGLEMWRRLHLEYRPHTSSRTVSLLEDVMEDKPRGTEDFSVWYYRWLELIRQAEQARGKLIDDDIKCAVATRRSPKELREHLILQSVVVADRFSVMHDMIVSWMTARKSFGPSGPEAHKHDAPTPIEISAMGKGFGKYKGSGKD